MMLDELLILLKRMLLPEKVQVGALLTPVPVNEAQLIAVVEMVTCEGIVIRIIPELDSG